MIVGVDVGGTNTDCVLVDEKERLVCAVKTPTTDELSEGFFDALQQLLKKSGQAASCVQGIYVGTTHATNAVLQGDGLNRVGTIRIAGQRPECLPVAYAWPSRLREQVVGFSVTIGGGFECSGQELSPLSEKEVRTATQRLLDQGVESIAIVGVFSPLNARQEQRVAELIREQGGSIPLSLSSEIGGIGFVERENSTILNAALKGVMERGFSSLQKKCDALGFTCPLMITQNDGSLISVERAIEYPVLTISAGPTNSFVGGSLLAGCANAIVVDIGGTSSDAGIVRGGFPLRSLNKSSIGGVSLNFSVPDVVSIALGGGSVVERGVIGPRSVAKNLGTEALCFGGGVMTLTDVAVARGLIEIPGVRIPLLSGGDWVFEEVGRQLADLVRKIRGEYADFPVVVVGGGAPFLVDCDFFIPENYQVANAYGAALAQISGSVDTVVSLEAREDVLGLLHEEAKRKALANGAGQESLRLVDQQIIAYPYAPNKLSRVLIRYCGFRSSKFFSRIGVGRLRSRRGGG